MPCALHTCPTIDRFQSLPEKETFCEKASLTFLNFGAGASPQGLAGTRALALGSEGVWVFYLMRVLLLTFGDKVSCIPD